MLATPPPQRPPTSDSAGEQGTAAVSEASGERGGAEEGAASFTSEDGDCHIKGQEEARPVREATGSYENSSLVLVNGGYDGSSPVRFPPQHKAPVSANGRAAAAPPMRHLSSTASSLDADDEADSFSHATTPPTSHGLVSSPNSARPGSGIPVASIRPRKLMDGAVPVAASSSLSSSSHIAHASPPPRAKRDTTALAPAAVSSGDSTDASREASASNVNTTTASCGGGEARGSATSTTEDGGCAAATAEAEGNALITSSVALLSGQEAARQRSSGQVGGLGASRMQTQCPSPRPPPPKSETPVCSPLSPSVAAATRLGHTSSSSATRSPAVLSSSASAAMGCGSLTNLEQFGCCVFFFPTPFLSWLLPLSGHVAISNAEGTRLYTFESSYFVREERMVDVLDRVMGSVRPSANEAAATAAHTTATASTRAAPCGGLLRRMRNALRLGQWSEREGTPRGVRDHTAMDRFSRTLGGDDDDAPLLASSNGRPACRSSSGRSYSGSPIRRQVKQLSSIKSGSHSHTSCVCIWDLKPLLMESRGGDRSWLPLRLVSKATVSSSTVAAVWQRLQELIPVESTGRSSSSSSSSEGTSTPSHSRLSRSTEAAAAEAAVPSARARVGGSDGERGGSGSETEEERNRLLDAATARFYNRNVQATINVFRGSPEGSRAPLDIIVKSTNSYSFVGFVLETCGLGGGTTLKATAPPKPTTATSPTSGGEKGDKSSATMSAEPYLPPNSSAVAAKDVEIVVDGISWGVWKIWLNICLFGKWYRSERRVWRVTHGGTMAGALVLWTALIAVLVSCVLPLVSSRWNGAEAAGAATVAASSSAVGGGASA